MRDLHERLTVADNACKAMESLLKFACGEHRDIEEEIANRILSDISEETSLAGSLLSIDDIDLVGHNTKNMTEVNERNHSGRSSPIDESRDTTPIASPTLTIDSIDVPQPPLLPVDNQCDDAKNTNELPKASKPSDLSKESEDKNEKKSFNLPHLDQPGPYDDKLQYKNPMELDPKVPVGAPLILEDLTKPHALGDQDVLSKALSPRSPTNTWSLPGTKSPVMLSPGREYAMEVVIATKKGVPQFSKKIDETTKELPETQSEKKQRIISTTHELDLEKYRPSVIYKEVEYEKPDIDDDYWDSNYQIGPETLLLATRGAEFNARLRDYRRFLWGEGAPLVTQGILGLRNQEITVRERRRYTDLVREQELGLNNAPLDRPVNTGDLTMSSAVRRMRTDIKKLTPAIKKSNGEPIFKRRLKNVPVTDDTKSAVLECEVVGKEEIKITWSHFDSPIAEDAKYKMYFDGSVCRLSVNELTYAELGDYTCIAINEYGSDKTTAILISGEPPGRAEQPAVELASDTEAFIMWEPPLDAVRAEAFTYKLELRPAGEMDHFAQWRLVAEDIEEDAAVVKHLTPLGVYQFRVTVKNAYGYGMPSLPSRTIQTHPKGVPKLQIDELKQRVPLHVVTKPAKHNFPQQSLKGITEEEEDAEDETTSAENCSFANNKIPLSLNMTADPEERFKVIKTLSSGNFSTILLAVDKHGDDSKEYIGKIMENASEANDALQEFTALKECQHENVVHLIAAYQKGDSIHTFMEKLYEDIFQRFVFYDYYNEEQIVNAVTQIVSALHWIHYKGIAHLNITPANIMFTSRRSLQLKIIDFSHAQYSDSVAKFFKPFNVYWAAPELYDETQPVTVQSDVWSLGVITFCLLAGFHPFADENDTKSEIEKCVLKEKCNPNLIFVQATQESLRFVTWALKKNPIRRMRTEEALQHRWLSVDKAMTRRREMVRYPSSRLRKTALFTAEPAEEAVSSSKA
uniref:Ig-like domain-containing protein n=1 Tax=Syphacia muris TaxID=451379 RepID=A0A0N5AFV8_9BILA